MAEKFANVVVLSLASGLMLSACGGDATLVTPVPVVPGPTTPTPTPPDPTPDSEVVAFEGWAINPNTTVLVDPIKDFSDTSKSEAVTISDTSAGDGKISVTIGTVQYDLDGAIENGVPVFVKDASGMLVTVAQERKQSSALLARIGKGTGAAADLTGYSVLGTPTAANDLAGLKATGALATYTGTSHLVAVHEDGFRDSASGDQSSGGLTLQVDFGNDTFDGTMKLTSSEVGVTNFEITTVDAAISNGTIASGVLSADVTVAAGDTTIFTNGANQLGMDPASVGKLEGGFYGANAQEVGGHFEFSGSEPDLFTGNPPKKIVVQGGFLGTQ